jgi:transcriptional accessory protein Tex/SPT6
MKKDTFYFATKRGNSIPRRRDVKDASGQPVLDANGKQVREKYTLHVLELFGDEDAEEAYIEQKLDSLTESGWEDPTGEMTVEEKAAERGENGGLLFFSVNKRGPKNAIVAMNKETLKPYIMDTVNEIREQKLDEQENPMLKADLSKKFAADIANETTDEIDEAAKAQAKLFAKLMKGAASSDDTD